MDRRLKGLLAATTAVGAVSVADVAGADDHLAQEMRPMQDETPMHDEMQDGTPRTGTDTSGELARLRAEVAELNRREAGAENGSGGS